MPIDFPLVYLDLLHPIVALGALLTVLFAPGALLLGRYEVDLDLVL